MRNKNGLLLLVLPGLAFILILLAVFLRIWQYTADRSFGLDEAMLALNIVHRSFTDLTKPLDYNQGAPVLFLFIQKAFINLLGNRDYNMRLFPLIAGITSMFPMYKLAKEYVKGSSAYVALALLAINQWQVSYASENKQYSSDVMVALFLLLLAYRCLETKKPLRDFSLLGCAGLIAVWMSHPAVFILIGVGICLVLDLVVRKDWHRLPMLGLTFMVWLLSFAFLYFVSLRFLIANPNLLIFWAKDFMPIPPWRNVAWFYSRIKMLGGPPFALIPVKVSGSLLLIGCVSLFFRRWQLALLLVLPALITLLASGFHKYVFADRLLLFMAPLIFLLIAEGVESVRLGLSRRNRVIAALVWILLIGLLLYYPVDVAFDHVRHPEMREEIKPIMQYLSNNKRHSDRIYLYYGSVPAFTYYAPFYGFTDGDWVIGIGSGDEPEEYLPDIDQFIGHERVWFVMSHICDNWPNFCTVNEEQYYLDHLNKVGSKIDELKGSGASLYLYNLRTLAHSDGRD